ncbi:MAG: efflux transporter periplasmic adaptor subunit [Planctomycetaceae bacterium]|nr:efflux transporter periplasmic adaptor subunit [Planctomycetaceae bacterium]
MPHLRFAKLLSAAGVFVCLAVAQAQPSLQPATVIVTPVVQKEVAAGQTFVGVVVPSRRSVIGSAVDGRVVSLFVNDGDPVGMVEGGEGKTPQGQPLAQLLTETISIEIASARAEMELRKQELAEMLAGSRPEEIARTKAQLGATKALMEFAKSRLKRTKALFEQAKTASLEEYEGALSASLAAAQNHAAAQAAHDLVLAGPRKEQIEQARARFAVASEDVRRLESMRAKYTIRTRFEGYVVVKHVDEGAWVSRGDPVAEVVALDPIEIDVTLPERYVTHVRIGASVNVRVDSVPNQTFTGTVARIVPQADLRSRTFPVKIRLANPQSDDGHLLKAGMLAHATLAVGPPIQALLVPKDSLVLGGPQPVVMAVTTDEAKKQATVRPVAVALGIAQGSLIQVVGDLAAGQQVVVVGNERVRPGQPILPVAAATEAREAPSPSSGDATKG